MLQFQLLDLPTLGKLTVISCLFDLVYILSHLRNSFFRSLYKYKALTF